MQTTLKVRQQAAIETAGGKMSWDEVDKVPIDPQAALATTIAKLQEHAESLGATSDEKAKGALVAERLEHDAGRRLNRNSSVHKWMFST